MIEAFSIPFITIFLAELLDKSQVTILLLATQTKRHNLLLLGALMAFILVDGVAVFFGSLISAYLSPLPIRIISGVLFIILGILSLRLGDERTNNEKRLRTPLYSAFMLVFLSEWGDKTQIASGLFAAKYPPVIVFLGIICALFLLSALAVILGSTLLSKVNKQTVSTASGIAFILLGILFLLT